MKNPEDELLRSVALQNANSILLARQRAEEELLRAKQALEARTRELAQSLSMMRATLESTTDGILATDHDGRVTDFNETFVRIWDLAPELMVSREHRLIQQSISDLIKDQAGYLAAIAAIYQQSPPKSFDVLELQDGRVIERYSRIQAVDGRNVGRVWSFRDVTQYRRAEEERKELLESERSAREMAERASELKDDFLATLSHELRTPLNAIVGWSQMLKHGLRDEAKVKSAIESIERNARTQAQLIEDLLDMSRITSGKMRLDMQAVAPISIVEAAIETMTPAAEAKEIRLQKFLDPAAGPISGDPRRLQQVVWNLLSNAIKFTPHGGKVQVFLQRVNSHIEIGVCDTGIGISADFLPHVFERFRQADPSATRSYSGLGLGLSIVKSLVELHGGSIRAESGGQGQGTAFTVQLPLTLLRKSADFERLHPASTSSVAMAFEQVDLSGLKVLVVDDEADARFLLMHVFSLCGATVFEAGNADVTLSVIEKERPHILICDIGMPDVDGYELIRRVRALGENRGGKVAAIALTAFARAEDRTRALRAGFLVHVAKPVDPSEIVATVASVAGRT